MGDLIYYSYIENESYSIACMKVDGEDNKKVASECGKSFFVKGNSIYYISESSQDSNDKYTLCKIKTNGKNKKEIKQIEGTLDLTTINFSSNSVYYAKRNEDGNIGLYSLSLNGKTENKITDIKYYITKININDNWIFYIDENDNGDVNIFKVRLNGKDKQEM